MALSSATAAQAFVLGLYWAVTIVTTLQTGPVRQIAERHCAHFIASGTGLRDLRDFADWYAFVLALPIAVTSLSLIVGIVGAEETSVWGVGAAISAYGLVMSLWATVLALGPTSLTKKFGPVAARPALGLFTAAIQTASVIVGISAL